MLHLLPRNRCGAESEMRTDLQRLKRDSDSSRPTLYPLITPIVSVRLVSLFNDPFFLNDPLSDLQV